MAPSPTALLAILDAAVKDDEGLLCCLMRRFPLMAKRSCDLTAAEHASLFTSDLTNHFYTCDGQYGLVIEDTVTSRTLVKERNLNKYIHWGANTDPVQRATIADIVDVMHRTSPKDSLLTLFGHN